MILGVFALASLLLLLARQLMREISSTAEEWRKLKKSLKDEDL
jgi:hypothetical protein